MNVQVLSIKDKVQKYITDSLGEVAIDKDGDFSFRYGSTHVWIRVEAVLDAKGEVAFVAVRLFANVNNGVPASPELFEYVACDGRFRFGALRCYRKDGKVRVFLEHTLLGDLIDSTELYTCFNAMAETADRLDDEIKKRFGGVVCYEGSN